jgi:hypothetical protein
MEKTWNDLMRQIEKLTPEQREMPVKAWGESVPLSDCYIDVTTEAMYWDSEYCDEGCFGESDLSPKEWEERVGDKGVVKVCEKGTPYIWIG